MASEIFPLNTYVLIFCLVTPIQITELELLLSGYEGAEPAIFVVRILLTYILERFWVLLVKMLVIILGSVEITPDS